MKKIKDILEDKYNLFAFIQLIVSIILFITLVVLVIPEVINSINYLKNIKLNEEEIYGYHIVFHSKAIFYLIMFIAQICYSLYGIIDLIRYQNQRQAFKIMMRSIFYVSGILLFHYIVTILFFLILPANNILGIFSLLYFLIALEVALGGRLASNFILFQGSLNTRKTIGIITAALYLLLCLSSLSGLFYEFDLENLIFYSLEAIIAIFAILASIYYKDPLTLRFLKEPKVDSTNNKSLVSIPIDRLEPRMFYRNIDIEIAKIMDNIKIIPESAFSNSLRLREVYLPKNIKEIKANAFFNALSLELIIYDGNRADFKEIKLGSNAFTNTNIKYIYCKDGPIII